MKKILWIVILVYLSIPLYTAQPFTQIATDTKSLEITYPKYECVQQNSSFELNFRVFNNTNYVISPGADCYLALYNPDGTQTMDLPAITDGLKWIIPINTGNFSVGGVHVFEIYCNTTTQTGFASGTFFVNNIGVCLDEAGLNSYIISIIILLVLFIILIYFRSTISPEDKKNDELMMIDINWLKYLRPVLLVVCYLLLTSVFFILSTINLGYYNNTLTGNLFLVFFRIMVILMVPIILVLFIWMANSIFADRKIHRMIKMGVEFQGAERL